MTTIRSSIYAGSGVTEGEMEKVAIIGIGMTDFGKHLDKSVADLVLQSYNDSMADAGNIEHDDIDALIYCSMLSGVENEPTAITCLLNEQLGYRDRPAFRVEIACSSGAAGLRIAAGLINSGIHQTIMVMGFEKQNVDTRTAMMDYARTLDTRDIIKGYGAPGVLCTFYQEYMRKYPHCREEDFAAVAAKGHTYALDNPHAPFGRRMTVADVMRSPYISPPLHQFEVTPIVDGASSFIVTRPELAQRLSQKPPLYLLGSGMSVAPVSVVNINRADNINTRIAARQAFAMAGLSPQDIDVAEIYDCYTWCEVVCPEEIGFFDRGQGCIAAREGWTRREGWIPINTLGGNQGRGHPPGATAGAQIYDIARQLRGEAGAAQVKDATIGLIHELGSAMVICCTTLLTIED